MVTSHSREQARAGSRHDYTGLWLALINNPLWYVIIVSALAAMSAYFRYVWWLAGAVALVWGGWLVWSMVVGREAPVEPPHPYQDRLDQARVYQQRIGQLLRIGLPRRRHARRQRLAAQIQHWIEALEDLSGHLARVGQNEVISRDLAVVPGALRALEKVLDRETDPALRRAQERAIIQRRNQLAALEALRRMTHQAELQIENTLSQLGTIYSQLLTEQSTNRLVDYGRLSLEIDEARQRLHDRLEALREVKLNYQQEAFV